MFYGSDFKPDDVPVPRKLHHEWALLHEESPKNNYILCHEEALSAFNHTATFKQQSDFSLTLQYLSSIDHLLDKKYAVPVDKKNKMMPGVSPIVYVHSDCDVPSGRDEYMKELSKYIKVDSLGKCLNNMGLPKQ